MTKLLSKFTVGDTSIRFDAPAEVRGAPQLSLHPNLDKLGHSRIEGDERLSHQTDGAE